MYARSVLPFLALAISTVLAEDKIGWSGTVESLDGGFEGTFEVQDESTLVLKEFTLEDGSAPALYWWASETEELKDGVRISETRITGEHENEELEIPLDSDSGKTTKDFSVVGLWCETFATSFGQAKLEAGDGSSSGPSEGSETSSGSGSSETGSGQDSEGQSAAGVTKAGLMGALGVALGVAALMA